MCDRKTETAVKAHNVDLNALLENVPGGVYQFQYWPQTGESCFPYASAGIESIYGLLPSEIYRDASAVYERLHPEDRPRVEDSIAQSAQELSLWEEEYRVQKPDGRIEWVQGVARPEAQTDGSVLWHGHLQVITPQKVLRRDYERKNAWLSTIIEAAREVSIIATDAEGTITLFNPGAERLLGYSAEEVVGLCTPAVFHDPSEVQQRKRDIESFYKTRISNFETFVYECRHEGYDRQNWTYICADGSRRTVNLCVTEIRDSEQGLSGYLGVAVDLTDSLEAHKALLASEARFRGLYEKSPMATCLTRMRDGRLLEANPAMCRMLGYSESELRQLTYHDITAPGYEHVGEKVREALTHQSSFGPLEKVYLNRLGEEVFSILNGIGIRDEQGELYVWALLQDITERKKAEHDLNELSYRLRLATGAGKIGIWDWHIRSNTLIWDDMMYEVYGREFTPQTLTYDNWRNCVLPEDLALTEAALQHSIETQTEFNFRFRVQRSDGEIRHLAAHGLVLYDDDGPSRVIGCNFDITESQTYQERLIEAQRKAEVANRAKSTFLATMSHEIRTPLNGIIGFCELLMETHLNSEQQSYLASVSSSSEALLGLINDILDYSKIEADELSIESSPFALHELLDGALDLVIAGAYEKRLKLICEVSEAAPLFLRGDLFRLRQILSNLLSNAVKFTESGEVRLCVQSHLREDEADLIFEVSDTGIGLSEEESKGLFEPFRQANETTTRKFGGTGLGLSICKRLSELMQASLSVESQSQEGSVFTLKLSLPVEPSLHHALHAPLPGLERLRIGCKGFESAEVSLIQRLLKSFGHRSEFCVEPGSESHPDLWIVGDDSSIGESVPVIRVSDYPHRVRTDALCIRPLRALQFRRGLETALESTGRPSASEPAEFAGFRVLVVEDNTLNQKIILRLLQMRGFETFLAANGRIGVDLYLEERPDLVLMDCQMPVMDGFEATRKIRAAEQARKWGTTPIVALTAGVSAQDRQDAMEAGMDHFLSKPLKGRDVIEVLRRLLSC